jgi:hypothetical protein
MFLQAESSFFAERWSWGGKSRHSRAKLIVDSPLVSVFVITSLLHSLPHPAVCFAEIRLCPLFVLPALLCPLNFKFCTNAGKAVFCQEMIMDSYFWLDILLYFYVFILIFLI